ncbi:MAG: LptF/LptG family permease [Phycisphaeraceae bacterium]|nr:LptF/LptG family permease [Phycisphaerales bacterium]MCB9860139.1 LptF/LptG family permease [Phycisphaeraceae bacterium]
MKLLDRYIIKQYLFNTVALMCVLFCFIIAIDISLNIDRFLRLASDILRKKGETDAIVPRVTLAVGLIGDLWGPRLFSLYNTLLGVVLTAAMGFTVTQLVRHRELVAMIASGQSLHRVVRPFLIVAIAMTTVAIINQEIFLPKAAPLLTRDPGEAGSRTLGTQEGPLSADGHKRLFYAKSFDADKGELNGVYVLERTDNGMGKRRITADHATWDNGAWVLTNATIDRRVDDFDPSETTGQPTIDARATVPELRLGTDLDPTALRIRQYSGYAQHLSTAQLAAMRSTHGQLNTHVRDRLARVQYGRFATMIATVLAMLLVMPFFLKREPSALISHVVKAAPIAVIAIIGAMLGTAIPIPGVPVAICAFLPVMVLAPMTIASLSAMKT